MFSSRNTPLHAGMRTSRMERTCRLHSILCMVSSNRLSFTPAIDSLRPPDTTHPIFLHRMADVKPLMWGYKISREIARRMPHFRGEYASFHPAFAPGGPASVIARAEGPVSLDAPRIMYSKEDESALEAYVRKKGAWNFRFFVSILMKVLPLSFLHFSVTTGWHSVSFHSTTSVLSFFFRFVYVWEVGSGL